MPARRALLLLVTAVGLVAVSPVLRDVYSEVGDALSLSRWWLAAIVAVVALQMVANWELLRIVLRTSGWFDIAVSQLASNGASHVLPGGNAIGAGLQVRMLTTAGFAVPRVVTALAAAGVIGTVSGFVVLPLLVLAASAAGSRIDPQLLAVMWVSTAILAAMLIALVVLATHDPPWRRIAVTVSWLQARLRRRTDVDGLERRLLHERDRIMGALRDRLGFVGAIALARPFCDYLALLFSLRAVGANVNPAAVLAAFIVANVAGMIPITPGGLGFVEAGLAGVLTLAGASDVHAHLGVAIYRVGETWLPCVAGAIALLWFERRHRQPAIDPKVAAQPAPSP